MDGQNSIVIHCRHVFHGGNGSWYHLLEMMHFIDMFRLSPESIWFSDKNEIFLFIISHLGNIIEIHVINESHDSNNVHGVRWSHDRSLGTILNVHVIMVITISNTFQAPSGTILELSWDIIPIPVVSHPLEGRSTVTFVDLENIESWRHTENSDGTGFPEFDPLANSSILINDLTFLEVEGSIWLHWWNLNMGLELITWVSWCSFETENSLDWLLTEDWVSKSGGDVREFLVLGPFNVIFSSFIVIIMVSGWLISQSFLEFKLDGKSFSSWFSPSMVMFMEHVV